MKKFVFILTIFLIFSFGFSQHYVMKVVLKNGTIDTIRVGDINKIYFELNPTSIDENKIPNIADSFILLPNYPNPFNPSTIIQYDIPKVGIVEISIYDISGKLIKTILNQSQAAGLHKVHWDGRNEAGEKVASGIFVYTVKFDKICLSKKMILLKWRE